MANRKAAALFKTPFDERPNDEMAAYRYKAFEQLDVGLSIIWVDDEVKHRSVVPNIKLTLCNVGYDPVNLRRSLA